MARRTSALIVAMGLVLGCVGSAQAAFHLTAIDEVLTSYGGDPTQQFIEMRMLAGFQNALQNSVLAAFDASGNYIGDILVVPSNVANANADTRWLVATAAFQTTAGLTADFTMPSGILPTGGGMLCFGGGGGLVPASPSSWSRTDFSTYVDCVAYGTYSGPSNVRTGTPTALNGDGHSLQRLSVTGNNAADFGCADSSTPENNAGATVSLTATAPCPAPTATPTATITPTVTPTVPGCPAAPDAGCLSGFAKGLLLVKDAPAGKEKVLAKMIGGPALAQTDLGNPLSAGGTTYHLCLYSDAGSLVGQLDVDRAGATCGTAPCWKALGGGPPSGKGYKYTDKTRSADGVSQILYEGGVAGKSKALVKGAGADLPVGMAAALQSSTSATAQLRGSDAPQCLSVTLTDVKKHDPTLFKAKH